MSLYLRAAGVSRIVIHPYPKRRRKSYVDRIGIPTHPDARVDSADMTASDTACYQDFFRLPEAAEQAS